MPEIIMLAQCSIPFLHISENRKIKMPVFFHGQRRVPQLVYSKKEKAAKLCTSF